MRLCSLSSGTHKNYYSPYQRLSWSFSCLRRFKIRETNQCRILLHSQYRRHTFTKKFLSHKSMNILKAPALQKRTGGDESFTKKPLTLCIHKMWNVGIHDYSWLSTWNWSILRQRSTLLQHCHTNWRYSALPDDFYFIIIWTLGKYWQ